MMNSEGSFQLIGGPYNKQFYSVPVKLMGHRYRPTQDIVQMPELTVPSVMVSASVNSMPTKIVKYHLYELESIQANNQKFYFYRHSEYTIEDALNGLIYNSERML